MFIGEQYNWNQFEVVALLQEEVRRETTSEVPPGEF